LGILAQVANCDVAESAEQPTYPTGLVIVVHDKALASPFDRRLPTDRTDTVLLVNECIVLIEGETIEPHQVRAPVEAGPELWVE
jgi:hypothetical protein